MIIYVALMDKYINRNMSTIDSDCVLDLEVTVILDYNMLMLSEYFFPGEVFKR